MMDRTQPAQSQSSLLTKFHELCFANVDKLLDVTKQINNGQLTEGVNLYMEMLKSQEVVLKTFSTCSKPKDVKFMVKVFKDLKIKIQRLETPQNEFTTLLRII